MRHEALSRLRTISAANLLMVDPVVHIFHNITTMKKIKNARHLFTEVVLEMQTGFLINKNVNKPVDVVSLYVLI